MNGHTDDRSLPKGKPFDEYQPPNWDELFMLKVYLTAQKSKDPRTKIGAVLVRDRRDLTSGFNGIPEGVKDLPSRFERPIKYSYFEHAERNAIFTAARHGIRTEGATLYVQEMPCVDCARAIIQSGIKKIYVHEQFYKLSSSIRRAQWHGHDEITMQMFDEAKVELVMLDLPNLRVDAYLDGLVYHFGC
ncbi:unnamed protein product [Adineta steineri]|uniref:dCMP deaminase n=1 Tax=Adineta steineri TaxID=433720 RepID=A0A813YD59_9BILA|nr:unnamed protein product [Adineta steineri]CAF0882558.1 unnamed protein product [Adineta steineri]CAF0884874.1 unnamed protein product [Adineta steineri]CAF0888354.1 unnamed protein product [Adineta steineri]CAF0969623.1 unnamed protein product [Adineta steineri]